MSNSVLCILSAQTTLSENLAVKIAPKLQPNLAEAFVNVCTRMRTEVLKWSSLECYFDLTDTDIG